MNKAILLLAGCVVLFFVVVCNGTLRSTVCSDCPLHQQSTELMVPLSDEEMTAEETALNGPIRKWWDKHRPNLRRPRR